MHDVKRKLNRRKSELDMIRRCQLRIDHPRISFFAVDGGMFDVIRDYSWSRNNAEYVQKVVNIVLEFVYSRIRVRD